MAVQTHAKTRSGILPQGQMCGLIEGVHPDVTDKMPVLGVWFDSKLLMHDHMDMVCAKLLDGAKT